MNVHFGAMFFVDASPYPLRRRFGRAVAIVFHRVTFLDDRNVESIATATAIISLARFRTSSLGGGAGDPGE